MDNMATEPKAVGGKSGDAKPEKKKVVRQNKPRTFYMAYHGSLTDEPLFVFDKDELVDKMLTDRELQVKRITVPQGKRAKQKGTEGTNAGAQPGGSPTPGQPSQG